MGTLLSGRKMRPGCRRSYAKSQGMSTSRFQKALVRQNAISSLKSIIHGWPTKNMGSYKLRLWNSKEMQKLGVQIRTSSGTSKVFLRYVMSCQLATGIGRSFSSMKCCFTHVAGLCEIKRGPAFPVSELPVALQLWAPTVIRSIISAQNVGWYCRNPDGG